ncbi:purine-uracil permease NCS1-like [Triticum dicoccoides]|uniref:purine-uracil permease NCS1-like n=1 Tax=Triticum dicoccoides TaxID=85692 RepID=UPI001891C75E|nr:purine-uracil permease NCS1-like [Triticum dicoccoides]
MAAVSMALSRPLAARHSAHHLQLHHLLAVSTSPPRLPLLPRGPPAGIAPLHLPRGGGTARRIMPVCPRLGSGGSDDLAPTPKSARTMTGFDLASLWVGLVVGVPAYYLAGSLVDLGMSAIQGVATVTLANLIVLATLVLTAAPAVTHGLPFPVLARAAFGVHGAHVPAVVRAVIGCGWFGIESWIGGRAIFLLLPVWLKTHAPLLKPVPGLGASPLEIACLLVFSAAQLAVIMRGMDGIRKLEKYAAPVLVALTSALLAWAYVSAGGFGPILSLPPRLVGGDFWQLFFPALTANISFWSTVAINIPDFARYARSQTDQVLGQIGLPVFMGMFTFAGLAITSSTEAIFGQVISDPIELLSRIGGPATRVLAIFGITLAIITTNIAANVVAPANTLVALAPQTFTFAKGALATALLGIALQPWRLLGSSESFVFTWLLGNAALMGPIGGVVLADHYIVRRTALDVDALYSEEADSPYYFQGGFNVAAMVAMAAGFAAVMPGFLHKVGVLPTMSKALVVAYDNAWFVSFFIAGAVYSLLRLRRGVEVKRQYSRATSYSY